MEQTRTPVGSETDADIDSPANSRTCDQFFQCVRCHRNTKLMCERCGDHYCSIGCQTSDWIRHKKICFPLMFTHRFVRTAESKSSKGSVNSIDDVMKCDVILLSTPRELRAKVIPSRTNVHIVSIVDHKTLFVRPSSAAADNYLCKLFDDIDWYGNCEFRPLTQLPECGGIYLTEFEEAFYRVYVLAAKSRHDKIDVFFVDFGNFDRVWLNQLSELSVGLQLRSILLNKIYLADVPDDLLNENPSKFLNRLYEDEVEFSLVWAEGGKSDKNERDCGANPKMCHLKFAHDELTLNRKLIELNANMFTENVEECRKDLFAKHLPIYIYEIPYLWSEGQNVEMQILQNYKINSNGYLTCIRRDKKALFDRYMADVAEYGKTLSVNEESHRPCLHEVCLVIQVERKRWCRAFCADPDVRQINFKALMVLMDYDDVLRVPFSQIRKLPPALAFPVLPIDCVIHELISRRIDGRGRKNLQDGFKLNQNITFDSMKQMTDSVKIATVSCKQVLKLIEN